MPSGKDAARAGEALHELLDLHGSARVVDVARIGYDGYAAFTGGKTFDGRPMPSWDELPDRIRDAWAAAFRAVALRLQDLDPDRTIG